MLCGGAVKTAQCGNGQAASCAICEEMLVAAIMGTEVDSFSALCI
jgi:hypothetical protein